MGVKGLKSDTIFEPSLFLTLFLKRQNFVTDGEGVGVKNVHHHHPPLHLAHHTFKLTIVLSSRFCLHGNNYLKPGYSRLIYV